MSTSELPDPDGPFAALRLFKRDNERGYIPEAIAPRVTRLLGGNGDMTDRLRESYDLRILIAHGRWDYQDAALVGAIEIAEDVLRRSISVLVNSATAIDTLA